MSIDEMRSVARLVKDHAIRNVAFFNLGEPFASGMVYDHLRVLREANSALKISISTNGRLIDTDLKRRAALMADHIYFSIDGADDAALRRYQRNGDFERSYANMKDLVRCRDAGGSKTPVIEWKYVLFNWNDSPAGVREAVRKAEEAGVDILSFWPTIRPFWGISWRYFFLRRFDNIGQKSWKGREILFTRKDNAVR